MITARSVSCAWMNPYLPRESRVNKAHRFPGMSLPSSSRATRAAAEAPHLGLSALQFTENTSLSVRRGGEVTPPPAEHVRAEAQLPCHHARRLAARRQAHRFGLKFLRERPASPRHWTALPVSQSGLLRRAARGRKTKSYCRESATSCALGFALIIPRNRYDER